MFNSEQLTSTFESTKTIFETCANKIATVSDDIKKLEATLKGFGVNRPFTYLCTSDSVIIPEIDREDYMEGLETHYYEYLAWELNDKEKNPSFRLFYKKYEQDGYIATDGSGHGIGLLLHRERSGEKRVVISRPLAETASELRLKMYTYIPTFLEKFANELSINQHELNHCRVEDLLSKFDFFQ